MRIKHRSKLHAKLTVLEQIHKSSCKRHVRWYIQVYNISKAKPPFPKLVQQIALHRQFETGGEKMKLTSKKGNDAVNFEIVIKSVKKLKTNLGFRNLNKSACVFLRPITVCWLNSTIWSFGKFTFCEQWDAINTTTSYNQTCSKTCPIIMLPPAIINLTSITSTSFYILWNVIKTAEIPICISHDI